MLFRQSWFETADPIRSLSQPAGSSWAKGSECRPVRSTRDSGLAALVETTLASRFCSWKGLSGRRYIFSVYSAAECPAFCDAVLLAAARDHDGRRRAVSVFDTGEFPEPVLLEAKRGLSSYGGPLEFHLHLLAATAAERANLRADLPAPWSFP